jgi:Planctomycete cytochrome C
MRNRLPRFFVASSHLQRSIPLALLAAAACVPQVDLPDIAPAASASPGAWDTPGKDAGWASGSGGSGGAPSGSTGSTDPNCDAIKTQTRAILQANCTACHGPTADIEKTKFNYILDTAQLKASGKVVPGSPETSPIYKKMASGEMPPRDPKPSKGDVKVIEDWIKVCLAPPSPTTGGAAGGSGAGSGYAGSSRARIDTPTVLRWMADDISRVDANDRPFTRYFTLVHLYNIGASDADLDLYRFALAKATNALSQGIQVVAPVAIDKWKTVYRIDLRDYRWEARGQSQDKWEALVDANPYAIEYLEDDAETIKLFSGTKVPFQGGDWFVNAATQAPLYNVIANIPGTRAELERQLGINIQQDIDREEVWRSGFQDSGISLRNRVIERHDNPQGGSRSLWISYDFAGNGGRENIFSDPLDFQPDASELIFSLPNGFDAYMVVDGAGRRIDVADDQIVVDPEQRDKNVHNGISCLGCHDAGMKFKKDELRDYVTTSSDFNVDTKDSVARLHPTPAEFQALIDYDSKVYSDAVARINPSGIKAEPIIQVFNKFENSVDLNRAAEELGISPEQLLSGLGRLDPALASLATGTVTREVFRGLFAQSVCILNIGLTGDEACNNR